MNNFFQIKIGRYLPLCFSQLFFLSKKFVDFFLITVIVSVAEVINYRVSNLLFKKKFLFFMNSLVIFFTFDFHNYYYFLITKSFHLFLTFLGESIEMHSPHRIKKRRHRSIHRQPGRRRWSKIRLFRRRHRTKRLQNAYLCSSSTENKQRTMGRRSFHSKMWQR